MRPRPKGICYLHFAQIPKSASLRFDNAILRFSSFCLDFFKAKSLTGLLIASILETRPIVFSGAKKMRYTAHF